MRLPPDGVDEHIVFLGCMGSVAVMHPDSAVDFGTA